NFDDVKKCGTCHGSGRVVTERRQGNMIFQQQATCNTCGGTGQTIATKCSVCGGSKISHGSEYLPLFVEKGMSDGQRITFRGACDQQPDTHPGDLHFVITTQRHPTFAREGNNLRIKMQITLLEALVGFSKTLRHLDGHEFTVARTAITTPGFVQKIPQEGMPIHEATTFGDLFVEYSIRFPKQLSDAQKQAFRELLR
ncbi:MAG: DnaJ C-terminal domain-containing protein, partial [archaeon]|nr:DnaJ C-terminal domain-containing protein [archaeon]